MRLNQSLPLCLLCAALAACGGTGAANTWPAASQPVASYTFTAGSGDYLVQFNYTGQNWTHADVKAIPIATDKPIAVLPQQYTSNGRQPGAFVTGRHIGRIWNVITQDEMARRLRAMGFHVLLPTIQMYGESLEGFQGLEHFIAGVAKGNRHVQVVLLTADAHNPNDANPLPGAQMLVTGLHPRDAAWEQALQRPIAAFYQRVGLGNRGPRVRGGGSDVEGSSQAWHPLIERAAEYTPAVTIMEVSRAIDIEDRVGRIENGRAWAAELFDGVAQGMATWACSKGFKTSVC